MIANYHTHTPLCHHAWGDEEVYVQNAIAAGLQVFGFSDHAPYCFTDGYYSTFRMRPEELAGYCARVLSLREKYAHKLQIPLGLEIEYYPKFFSETLSMLRDSPIEYLLLGQHFLGNEFDDIGTSGPSCDPAILRHYCDQTIEAMYTGLFSYFAHPDLIHFVGEHSIYRAQMRRVCRAAKECGIPLEINLLGLREGRHYPTALLWEVAAEENCPVILGIDAHRPENVLNTAAEKTALNMVSQYGLTLLEAVPLRSIK